MHCEVYCFLTEPNDLANVAFTLCWRKPNSLLFGLLKGSNIFVLGIAVITASTSCGFDS